jgi:antitoxin CptB
VSSQAAAGQRRRVAWRCRRGMKELDLLLIGWLEAQFERASEAQRGQFEALLELPDPQLARYLLGGERPERADLAAVVDAVLTRNNIMSSPVRGGNLP